MHKQFQGGTRRTLVTDILRARGAITIEQLRDEFIGKNMSLPAANNDEVLHKWLTTIDEVKFKTMNNKRVYYFIEKEPNEELMTSAVKRKNTSPLKPSRRQLPKRSIRIRPLFEETPNPKKYQSTPVPTWQNRRAIADFSFKSNNTNRPSTSLENRLLLQKKKQSENTTNYPAPHVTTNGFLETPQIRNKPVVPCPTFVKRNPTFSWRNPIAQQTPRNSQANISQTKVTSTAFKHKKQPKVPEEIPKRKGIPKLYGAVIVGDDNFLNIVNFDLEYESTYHQTERRRIRRCGYCFSGLKILQAASVIESMDESVKHVIINVGSVDIAEGRQLIEMVNDLRILLNVCEEARIDPILTTLAPLPNHLLSNKRDIIEGFNRFLKEKINRDYPVIDINKTMVTSDGKIDLNAFQPIHRKMSGSKESLVMWNKLGRKKVFDMIIKHLGHALMFHDYLGTYI